MKLFLKIVITSFGIWTDIICMMMYVHHTCFCFVIQHYGKNSVIVQTSKVKAYFFTKMFWNSLEQLKFCAQSCRVSAYPCGLIHTAGTHLPAEQGSWEHFCAQGKWCVLVRSRAVGKKEQTQIWISAWKPEIYVIWWKGNNFFMLLWSN